MLAYLIEENRVLRRQLGGRRLRLTDDDRRQLAARAHRLGRQVLRDIATIVAPDTLLAGSSHANGPTLRKADGRYGVNTPSNMNLARRSTRSSASIVHINQLQAVKQGRPANLVWRSLSVAWTENGSGFFYGRYPEPLPGKGLEDVLRNKRIYYQGLDNRLLQHGAPTHRTATNVQRRGRLGGLLNF